MNFEQEGIRIAETLQIRYYGLIIVVAMLVAAIVAARLAKRDGRDPEHVWGALTWAIIPGILLARLWFVVFPPASLTAGCSTEAATDVCRNLGWFLQNIGDLQNGPLAIWSGGLGIWGAVLGGLLGVWLYFGPLHNRIVRIVEKIWRPIVGLIAIGAIALGASNGSTGVLIVGVVVLVIIVLSYIPRVRKVLGLDEPGVQFPETGMPIGPWLDIAAVVVPLAQAIGRWANFVNQELYGAVTSLPWGIQIDASHRVAPFTSTIDYPYASTFFHPLFLYESLLSILAFIVLLNLFLRYRNRFRAGDLFLVYVMQYTVIRFLLEFVRAEPAYLPGSTINSSQTIAVIGFVIALLAFIYRHRPGAVAAAQAQPQPVQPKQPAAEAAAATPQQSE
jgi:prolipoprotein diacylglyceryl transferase